jgi:hypothetical protein
MRVTRIEDLAALEQDLLDRFVRPEYVVFSAQRSVVRMPIGYGVVGWHRHGNVKPPVEPDAVLTIENAAGMKIWADLEVAAFEIARLNFDGRTLVLECATPLVVQVETWALSVWLRDGDARWQWE